MLIIINNKKIIFSLGFNSWSSIFPPLKVIEYQVLYKSKTLGWIGFIKHNPIKS